MVYIYEYIWLDHKNGFRSKTKVTKEKIELHRDNGIWNYDGSSTEQANGNDSEVYIKPVRMYRDPFRKNLKNTFHTSFLVLCDTWLPNGSPHPDNTREAAKKIFENKLVKEEDPMFGIEQEFFFTNRHDKLPLGMKNNVNGSVYAEYSQGPYYCGVGTGRAYGRKTAEKILENALYCELNITGLNFEVAPGQCEFQLCEKGLKCSDDLNLLRYLMVRTAEDDALCIDFHPKPVEGDWNGSGCHTNFSTKLMRDEGGLEYIMQAIMKLKEKHKEHIDVYGKDNDKRLTGKHETASFEEFSFGVANRGSSIRIPRFTDRDGKGYLEDRRPSSNMDPYIVTSKIVDTTILWNDKHVRVYAESGYAE
jgi:glutamine synthetase